MKQDQSIHDRIATITKEAFTQEAVTTILHTQLDNLKKETKEQMEQQLALILEPTKRSRNPHHPVDCALKNIKTALTAMVTDGIHQIGEIIQGMVDQAIEDVRLSTKKAPAPTPETAPPDKNNQRDTVTPKRTFRGKTIQIDDPLPRQD